MESRPLRKRKGCDEERQCVDTENKLRSYMKRLNDEMDAARQRLDRVRSYKEEIESINRDLVTIESSVASNQNGEKTSTETEAEEAATERRAADLRQRRAELMTFVNALVVDRAVADTCSSSPTPQPRRVGLKEVYESQAYCGVCFCDVDGKDVVYLSACTHTFCKSCVTKRDKQFECMGCRSPVCQMYTIVQTGERHGLRWHPTDYDFIQDKKKDTAFRRWCRQQFAEDVVDVDDEDVVTINVDDDDDDDFYINVQMPSARVAINSRRDICRLCRHTDTRLPPPPASPTTSSFTYSTTSVTTPWQYSLHEHSPRSDHSTTRGPAAATHSEGRASSTSRSQQTSPPILVSLPSAVIHIE